MPSNRLILCRSLLLPSVFPSTRVFSSESVLCIRSPKYWSFSISFSNEYSGLISFRMDWLDLLAFQRTLKSLLQHHSSKASVVQCSAFFMVQLSHDSHMTTGETITLTRWTFVGKVMSLLFNKLSRLGHSFSSNEQVSFNFMAAVTIGSDFGAQENMLRLNTLSRCIITFLPRSKCLLISWLQSLSAVTFGGQVCHCFHCFLIYLP